MRVKRWWLEHRAARKALVLKLFDADYYREVTRGRKDEVLARRRPLRHYLSVGGFEGLNPCSDFDSAWYLANYRDVQASGLNPLVHYILYGRAEGRRRYLGARAPHLPASPQASLARQLGEQLWAGFAWRARPELETLAQQGHSEAAWQLARWTYALGEYKTAAEWLAVAAAPEGAPQRALASAKCGMTLNDGEKAALTAENRALVAVNETVSVQSQLKLLNNLYQNADLATLELGDEAKPLSLDNLCAHPKKQKDGALVSVVMCAHNAETTLSTALESVLAQSWQNLEVVVVNDASTDQTGPLVRQFAAMDGRVRLVTNDHNLGAYGARNRGVREASGKYITVHDSDDWSHPQKVERQVAPLLADPALIASVSHWVRVRPPFTMIGAWQLDQGFLERNPSSWMVHREAFARIGYWDEVRVEADTEFALRLEHHYGRDALVTVLPDIPMALARTGAETLTQQSASHVRTQFYGLRRVYAESARSWHRAAGGEPVLIRGHRPFSVPWGSIIGARPAVNTLVVSNFAVAGESLKMLMRQLDDCLQREPALCLMHWPSRTAWVGNEIADEVFHWAQHHGVHWAHPGLTLEARRVELVGPLEWGERPSPVVVLPEVEAVVNSVNELYGPQDAWLGYFRSGGECS